MSLKGCIEAILKIPVLEHFEPVLPPCATFYQVSDLTGLAGDGEETEGMESWQAEIWCRKSGEAERYAGLLKRELRSRLPSATVPQISYTYDNYGKVWRASVAFQNVREE